MTAQRLQGLERSAIRRIADPAPADAIALGLGVPTWDMPEPARLALAATRGPCPYGLNAGTPELRAAIAAFHGVDVDRTMVSCGTQGVLYCLFQAWLEPGDAALLPDPGFVGYPALARLAGAQPVSYALRAEDDYQLNPDVFIAALHSRDDIKLALINHPGNPTGAGATAEALSAIAAACAARDVLLVSDEVYRELYFEQRPVSLLDVADTGVVATSVSKAFGSPGLRIGWAVGDPRWLRPASVVHAYMATAAALPAQRAAVALLAAADQVLPAARREIATRFAALAAALREHLSLTATPPAGSFYYRLALPRCAVGDPIAFCERLRDEAKVVLIPGLVFGENGRSFARLSFAAPAADVAEGVRRLAPLWQE